MRKRRKLKIKDAYLQLIVDIGYDYDGYYDEKAKKGNAVGLANTLKDIVQWAEYALENDDKQVIYTRANGKKTNILHEVIREVEK